jgi:UDP-3-O-[3-hydroxymyristoyl] N-acetylglucosamine deacetylase
MLTSSQRTINSKISCNSVGLHSGANVTMTFLPAPCNHGIIFKRTDLSGDAAIVKADFRNVVQTNLGTVIANEHGARISTIEHVMAAIWGCGIDNLLVEVDAAEAPIMDGSSEPFLFLIECAGIEFQQEPRKYIEIMKKFRAEDGDKFIEATPAREFSFDLSIDFQHQKIQQQKFSYNPHSVSFKSDFSRARTFGFKHEIEHLHKIGLAKGGSLDNAILVDENGIVNEGGLRFDGEFVKHKAIDFIGDMYLAGHQFLGHFNAHKSGHGINNKFLRELFKDESAWRII